jgi:hypothetical protein
MTNDAAVAPHDLACGFDDKIGAPWFVIEAA